MICGLVASTNIFPSAFTSFSNLERPKKLLLQWRSSGPLPVHCSASSPRMSLATETEGAEPPLTGGSYDFLSATTSLTEKMLECPKKVTLVRHGLSSWNEESRVQGSSNLSVLTETGVMQAERCKVALSNRHFDQCFSSPISRAKSTAEVIWKGREEPLVFLDSLKEAHLFFLEGMKNAEARAIYPREYTTWREDPSNFSVNGVYPVQKLWGTAREAWREILISPGKDFLVVTHKSMLRALVCTSLGLGPERFRAVDINNGGISIFNFNTKGEAMLQALNMTAHMYSDYYYIY
ncbi:probable 2-carboxy-D-arabinitol-1-phosphatase [Punica granatum]|uniref:Probable 2-carboxy-D-arabinitol-1-phosphatase n=1 Tax=Punica granatum TaxID=22663 RepID=A0A6P8DSG5_PUNGR|nr:probable 2-carboxy-D-arabinitol-1-phosphatase [Punica granatum]